MAMDSHSVTLLIRAIENQDTSAEQVLFDRYFKRLVAFARRKLGSMSRRVDDEEDVAITAFCSCLLKIKSGHSPQISDRKHLWRLLVILSIFNGKTTYA